MMVMTDSIKIYNQALHAQSGQNQQTYYQKAQCNNYNNSNSPSADCEYYYVDLIKTMIYELVTKRESDLLSALCSVNKIKVEVVNFTITYSQCTFKSTYDLLPIIQGLNTAFSKNLTECRNVYSENKTEIFRRHAFHPDFDSNTRLTEEIKKLDDNIGRLLLSTTQAGNNFPQMGGYGKTKNTGSVKTVLRIHDPKLTDKLNQLAANRIANDSALSEQIQQLQVMLQEELKQIISIRDGIDYNITQEAISQFTLLFSLISETLQYHPNNENIENYHNLVESCEDFLENIKQSLTMLGVTIINDVGKPFDPEKHKTLRGIQPTRQATITKVVKVGFSYKSKVLEKAEVELDLRQNR